MVLNARAQNSPIRHLTVKGSGVTKCGKDTAFMHKWDDNPTYQDKRIYKACQKCRD